MGAVTTKVELWGGPFDGKVFIWSDPPPIEFRMPIPTFDQKVLTTASVADSKPAMVIAVYIRRDHGGGIWDYDWEGYE
jgi:hypothetical protein